MFDGIDPPRQPPGRRPVNERAVTIIILVYALLLLFMPVSVDGVADIVRYFRGH